MLRMRAILTLWLEVCWLGVPTARSSHVHRGDASSSGIPPFHSSRERLLAALVTRGQVCHRDCRTFAARCDYCTPWHAALPGGKPGGGRNLKGAYVFGTPCRCHSTVPKTVRSFPTVLGTVLCSRRPPSRPVDPLAQRSPYRHAVCPSIPRGLIATVPFPSPTSSPSPSLPHEMALLQSAST